MQLNVTQHLRGRTPPGGRLQSRRHAVCLPHHRSAAVPPHRDVRSLSGTTPARLVRPSGNRPPISSISGRFLLNPTPPRTPVTRSAVDPSPLSRFLDPALPLHHEPHPSSRLRPAPIDQISLGEIMLRLDPGEGRIRTAREFKVWEGGGEYNVARGLRKCFGLRTAVCTAFVDNDVGRLIEDFILQGGVATDFILWRADDGIGRSVRNGLNFTERGFGIRGAVGDLRPRQHRRQPAQARRFRLGDDLRQARRALVPHRRHLRRALRDDRRPRDRGRQGRPPARHDRQLRPQLPARRSGRASAARRRPARSTARSPSTSTS